MVSPPPKTIGGYYNKNSMNMTWDLNSYNSVDGIIFSKNNRIISIQIEEVK